MAEECRLVTVFFADVVGSTMLWEVAHNPGFPHV